MDATLIPVPKQRNTREENPTLKQGEVPVEWQEPPHKRAQTDVNARWTKQNGTSHDGDKTHISNDVGFKFMRRYTVTAASVHDSQGLGQLLDADNRGDGLWAARAYLSGLIVDVLKLIGFEPHINERAYRRRQNLYAKTKTALQRTLNVQRIIHNWVRPHWGLGGKVTPAMAMGFISRPVTMHELLNSRGFKALPL